MVDARLFQALSDSTRLDILALLAGGTINVSRMVARLGYAQPAVSRHLRVLREAQLITDKRKGKEVEYSISPGALAAAAAYLGNLASAEGAAEPGQQLRHEPRQQSRQQSPQQPRERSRHERRTKVPVVGRRRATGSTRPAGNERPPSTERPARQPASRPSGDFAPREGEFVIEPRRKSGLDDFLL